MGMEVTKREPKIEIESPKIVMFGGSMPFMGLPTFESTAEKDADILKKAEKIMQNKRRYKAAKKVLEGRAL